MRFRRVTAALGLMAGLAAPALGEERNAWPFWVHVSDVSPPTAGDPAADLGQTRERWQAIGPLVFAEPLPTHRYSTPRSPVRASGFRPFYFKKTDAAGVTTDAFVLPPFFHYHADARGCRWSFFSLINQESAGDVHVARDDRERRAFEVWPFYLSRQTGAPETSYRALFPIYGRVKYRFGQDRWSWVLFPLYGRFEKNNVVTTTAPWPFVKHMAGEGNRGFELWPLYGWRAKDGAYREKFFLWPLIFKNERQLWEPQPAVKKGFLPFYYGARDTGLRDDNWLLFFGRTERTEPYRYEETRYFWPLFVQARGDERFINRWAPFYSHSVWRGTDKTWILWPLWRERVTEEAKGTILQTKHQLLYFLYNSTVQRSAADPSKPAASRRHLWPLFSTWNDGAGRRQIQALSPFEVFFPQNETVRVAYSPLFALYRYDRADAGHSRHTLLWNFISWRRAPQEREFHLGPIFSADRRGPGRRYALLAGTLGLERKATGGWRFFLFDFKRRAAPVAAQP